MARLTDRERGPIALAEKVLTLLDEGVFTATYKYAVLLGLIDLCLENTTAKGAPPDSLTTRQLAEKNVEIYWPQATIYPAGQTARVLKQNRGKPDSQARILVDIQRFRDKHAGDPTVPLAQARHSAPKAFERLVQLVEWKLIEMPLPRLQIIGGREDTFLYTISWDQSIERQVVREYQQRKRSVFNNNILLQPGVSEYLVQLNGLLRPLIHRQWAVMVASLNQLEEARLEQFLFGAERVPTQVLRPGLREIQDDRCFYCEGRLSDTRGRRPEVDHFVPWARYPNNAIENLVLAHERCNLEKRDFLAAEQHLAAWRGRLKPESGTTRQLVQLAEDKAWETAPERCLSVARAIYLRLPDGYKLWLSGQHFDSLDRKAVDDALA
jgi:5-methylcytosine-specific restriction endonuclease McrA